MIEAGFGQAQITPEVGAALSGFIFRENKPSTSIDDPLWVRVCAFRDEAQISLLFSYELLGIGAGLYELIIGALRQELGDKFHEERCVLTATHSHSGPPTVHLEGEAEPNPFYWQMVIDQTLRAVREAMSRLQPAILFSASMPVPDLTYNRRAVLADGRVSMALQPDSEVISRGPVDDLLTLLVLRDSAGNNLGSLVHFASHGVAVCTQAIGADVPGQIARRFGKLLSAPCLYLQGCAGDLNPVVVSTRRDEMLPWVEVFMSMTKDLPTRLQPVDGQTLDIRSMNFALEYAPLPAREAVLEHIAGLEQIARGDVTSPNVQTAVRSLGNIMNITPGEAPDPAKAAYCAQALVGAGKRTLRAIDQDGPLPPCPLHLSVWKIGNISLAFVAAELFAATGIKLRALHQSQIVLPVTYASPLVGYIPDFFSLDKGGYEVDNGWQFYGHPAPFTRQAEIQVIQAVAALL
jgi:neutral ceramidase